MERRGKKKKGEFTLCFRLKVEDEAREKQKVLLVERRLNLFRTNIERSAVCLLAGESSPGEN